MTPGDFARRLLDATLGADLLDATNALRQERARWSEEWAVKHARALGFDQGQAERLVEMRRAHEEGGGVMAEQVAACTGCDGSGYYVPVVFEHLGSMVNCLTCNSEMRPPAGWEDDEGDYEGEDDDGLA